MLINNPDISLVSEFTNASNNMTFMCNIDGYEWSARGNRVANGNTGCPMCKKLPRKDQDYFVKEIEMINPDIEVVGKYTSAKRSIEFRCKIDNHKWMARPDNIRSGKGCPLCRASKLEKTMHNALSDRLVEFDREFEICGKFFDFKIGNVIIELDGIQHFEYVAFRGYEGLSLEDVKNNDLLKNNLALNNGYSIVRISYSQIDSIDKIIDEILSMEFDFPKVVMYGDEYF